MNTYDFNCLSEVLIQSPGLDENKNIRMDGRRGKSSGSGAILLGLSDKKERKQHTITQKIGHPIIHAEISAKSIKSKPEKN